MSQTTQSSQRVERSSSSPEFRVSDIEALLEHAAHVQQPTDLIIAPVDLHRRHLKQRVSQSDEPLSAYEFSDGATVAKHLLESTDQSIQSLDRVDRLDVLEEILETEGTTRKNFELLIGEDPTTNVKDIEQTRSEVEAVTNYHPTRIQAYRNTLRTLDDPTAADAHDVLYGALAVEGALRRFAEKAPTDTELLRRATRKLVESSGSIWPTKYQYIERVSIVGLSNISASLIDLLTAISRTTDIEAVITLRPATGPSLRERLPRTLVDGLGEVYAE